MTAQAAVADTAPKSYEDYVLWLNDLYREISLQKDVSIENVHAKRLFDDLSTLLSEIRLTPDAEKLRADVCLHQALKDLPVLREMHEILSEKMLAQRMLDEPEASLANWYDHERYANLAGGELEFLQQIQAKELVFLGSGAIPMTAIFFARSLNIPVIGIDFDVEACELSKQVIEKIGLSSQISIFHAQAKDVSFTSHQTVFCASLLKEPTIYDVLHADQFLYKPLCTPKTSLFAEINCTKQTKERVNITHLYKRVA